MQREDPAKEARDKLLDELKDASDAFYAKEMRRINAEEAFYRDVLKARDGARVVAKQNASRSKLLIMHDIGSLLTG